MEKQCAVCGQPMTLIPAGFSKKTNKPYSAFWACPQKCVQPRVQDPNWAKAVPASIKAPTPIKPPDWDKIGEKKADDIRANVVLKMVSEIIAGGKLNLGDWEDWANIFYNYRPRIIVTVNEASVDEDGFPTNEIPF